MSGHTPGPWRVVPDYLDGGVEPHVMAGEWLVATVMDGADSQPPEANARLIAAAPELLTAAIEAKSAMDSIWGTRGQDDDWIYDEMGSELSAGYFSLRAAIAKATTK